MRAEFQGGACDGHSHSVGPTPPSELGAPCRSAVHGRYVRSDSEPGSIVYRWQPGDHRDNPTISRLSTGLGLGGETE